MRVDTVALNGGLTLSGDDVEMVFEALEPVPDAELTGVTWVLDGLIQGEAVSTPVADTRGFIELSDDGSLRGDTGCRPFSGQYVIDGAEVLATELAADGHECEPRVADQDSLFFSVVGDGFRVEIEGNRLTMWSVGDEGLTFTADE
jgi:heat shock protein HslJ